MGIDPRNPFILQALANGTAVDVTPVKRLRPVSSNVRREFASEREFTDYLIGVAQDYGFRVAHFRPGMTKDGQWVTAVQGDGKGWPDLFLVRGRTALVAELKVKKNKPTPEQLEWLDAFRAAGIPAYVWHPDMIEEILHVLEGCAA